VKVLQEIPERRELSLEDLRAGLRSRERPLAPFAAEAVEFCAALSRALFTDPNARRFPAVVALAHRIRKAELLALSRAFAELSTPDTVLMPRGLAFHVPPSNVDTMFIYSWLFSFLVGNRNVIRLPARAAPPADAILEVFRTLVAGAPAAIRNNTSMVRYGHEREVTDALSASADLRVIWGGDEAVAAIRKSPLSPHARELTFPDRYSLCALRAPAWLGLDAGGRERIAEAFYNDAYWFDQMGCSSPRLVIWCGDGTEIAAASGSFFQAVHSVVRRRGFRVDTGTAIGKMTFAYRAVLDAPVSGYLALGNELTVLPVDALEGLDRDHCGGGLFFQFAARGLQELVPFVRRKDQTLTHFGFEPAELFALAAALAGRGIDRMVPVGQALAFDRYWDGMDLLQEMSRRVAIRCVREKVGES
jgi:hypothetical protein